MTLPRSLTAAEAYRRLIECAQDAQLLGGTAEVLHWDQEVLMPKGGLEYRSRQLAQLARLRHARFTAPEVGELISRSEQDATLVGDPESVTAVNIRELRHDYDRSTRLPPPLVEEEARLASLSQHHWAEARRQADFARFRPHLERIVDLLRRKAECFGWADGEPWDALAEDYEPGCTAAGVEAVFTPLRRQLQTLLDALLGSATRPSSAFKDRPLPVAQQQSFVRWVAEQIGFDFERGRLDTSVHPFCSGSHCDDVRLTTRFHEANVNDALGSTMHEAGHGMYEQGLPAEHIGTPMGEAVSLGLHESQSRLWENQVGRSEAFWRWCRPQLARFFGAQLGDLTFDQLYGGANLVHPDYIRVEADEATYNMHILVRFEIERALMDGSLVVGDLPDVWNAKYHDYLGLRVPDAARGCLQDIHWSMCSIGYFPTYTLGNLYAAQFFERAQADLPGLEGLIERGEFRPLKEWLNRTIHAHGRRFRAAALCERVTGKVLSADALMRHLERKLRPLYGV